jgi:hypothetical protein
LNPISPAADAAGSRAGERDDQRLREAELVLGGQHTRSDQHRLAGPGHTDPAGERGCANRRVVEWRAVELMVQTQRQSEDQQALDECDHAHESTDGLCSRGIGWGPDCCPPGQCSGWTTRTGFTTA